MFGACKVGNGLLKHPGFNSKGGGSGTTTQVQKADPWSGVQPALTELYSDALNTFRTFKPEAYQGTQVPDVSAPRAAAYQAMMGPQPLQQQAFQSMSAMLQPQVNPYLADWYNAAASQITPQVSGAFEKSGRYGSGAHARELTKGLSNLAAQMYGQDYRSAMQQAAAMAPIAQSMEQSQYAPWLQIAADTEQRQAAQLAEAAQRHSYSQQAPYIPAQQLAAILSGYPTGSTTTGSSTLPGQNPWIGAVSGAATGQGIAQAIAGGAGLAGGPVGWGLTLLGALLGAGG